MLSFFILFLIFVSAPLWNRFWMISASILGGFWHQFSNIFGKKACPKNHQNFILIFIIFLSIFGSKLALNRPRIAEKAGSWRLPGHLGDTSLTPSSSWLRFGTVLGRFSEGLELIFHTFRLIPLQFFFTFGFRFQPFFGIWLHCFLYYVRVTPRPITNKGWPGGLREAIK